MQPDNPGQRNLWNPFPGIPFLPEIFNMESYGERMAELPQIGWEFLSVGKIIFYDPEIKKERDAEQLFWRK
jgi:hypothetical protein